MKYSSALPLMTLPVLFTIMVKVHADMHFH